MKAHCRLWLATLLVVAVFLNYLSGDNLPSSFAAKKAHRYGGQKINLEPLGA